MTQLIASTYDMLGDTEGPNSRTSVATCSRTKLTAMKGNAIICLPVCPKLMRAIILIIIESKPPIVIACNHGSCAP